MKKKVLGVLMGIVITIVILLAMFGAMSLFHCVVHGQTVNTELVVEFHPYEWAKCQADIALEQETITQEQYEELLEDIDALDYSYEFDDNDQWIGYIKWLVWCVETGYTEDVE
jgi:hypothetical protein